MSTSRTAHRKFAVETLGVSTEIYDEMNGENERRNSAIRAARAEWHALPLLSVEWDAAGEKLDVLLATGLSDFRCKK